MIFDINTTSDISKLLYVILRAVRRVKFETFLKYHVQILLLFVYTTTPKRFVIFTCRYFRLSWNTTALSQSNCRNFSRRSINSVIPTSCSANPEPEQTVKFLKKIQISLFVEDPWGRLSDSKTCTYTSTTDREWYLLYKNAAHW